MGKWKSAGKMKVFLGDITKKAESEIPVFTSASLTAIPQSSPERLKGLLKSLYQHRQRKQTNNNKSNQTNQRRQTKSQNVHRGSLVRLAHLRHQETTGSKE
jgi:hypothetical protein